MKAVEEEKKAKMRKQKSEMQRFHEAIDSLEDKERERERKKRKKKDSENWMKKWRKRRGGSML